MSLALLFGAQKEGQCLVFLYKLYHRLNHLINEYLNNFVTVSNTRALTALGELALVILRCRTQQFSWSFLPAAVLLWAMLLYVALHFSFVALECLF